MDIAFLIAAVVYGKTRSFDSWTRTVKASGMFGEECVGPDRGILG